MRAALLPALLFLALPVLAADTNDAPAGMAVPTSPPTPKPKPTVIAAPTPPPVSKPDKVDKTDKPAPAKPATKSTTTSQMQANIDRLTQSNRDLLDLLKQQQAVLQDLQFDRRQQSRHIQSLEERLTDALQQNALLQKKVGDMATEAAVRPIVQFQSSPTNSAANTPPQPPPVSEPIPPPKPPDTYLPPAPPQGLDGKSWHRLFVLKGTDGRQTDVFNIRGRTWRLVWHNQDPDDKKLHNTAGLFVDAFPKDDTIPQHACAKVGSGGDIADLVGPGDYYLKITASGGSWELAVEDFR